MMEKPTSVCGTFTVMDPLSETDSIVVNSNVIKLKRSAEALSGMTAGYDGTNHLTIGETGSDLHETNILTTCAFVDPIVRSKKFALDCSTSDVDTTTTIYCNSTANRGFGFPDTSGDILINDFPTNLTQMNLVDDSCAIISQFNQTVRLKFDLFNQSPDCTCTIRPQNVADIAFDLPSSGGTLMRAVQSVGAGSSVVNTSNANGVSSLRSIIGTAPVVATQNTNDVTLSLDATVATLTGTQNITNKTLSIGLNGVNMKETRHIKTTNSTTIGAGAFITIALVFSPAMPTIPLLNGNVSQGLASTRFQNALISYSNVTTTSADMHIQNINATLNISGTFEITTAAVSI